SSDFDWCNMPNELITTTPNYSVERNAIAILLSDCGDKAEMEYCSSSCASSTTIGKARQALQNDYNYSNDMQHRYRWLTINWKSKMRNSLDDGDPILYGGNSDDAGHAFVCDGYENDNYFHFNWGWNGNSDGYFYIDDDDGSPVIDYKRWQEAVFYIHPDQQSNVYCIDCSEIISISNIVSSINPYNPNFPLITWSGISPLYNYIPFLNPIRPFASDIIFEIGEMRLEYFDITAGTINVDNVIIPDKTNVYLKSYNEIVITNFETKDGAEFTAEIIPCPDNTNSAKLNEQNSTNIGDIEFTDGLYHDKYQINPNPCSYETNIIYYVDENELFEIAVYDIYGKRLKTLIKGRQLKGTYSMTVNTNEFPNGLYLCVFKNQKETKTIKFVKLSE
ncbi:MAG: C10 family peptidase, partial [Bacteroidales bacterium]|nr:C10 family peptidase [Bacteroidales bacterium]